MMQRVFARLVLHIAFLEATPHLMHKADLRHEEVDRIVRLLKNNRRMAGQFIANWGLGDSAENVCNFEEELETVSDSQRMYIVEKIMNSSIDALMKTVKDLKKVSKALTKLRDPQCETSPTKRSIVKGDTLNKRRNKKTRKEQKKVRGRNNKQRRCKKNNDNKDNTKACRRRGNNRRNNNKKPKNRRRE